MIVNNGFLVKNDRFSLTEKGLYILHGWIAPKTEIRADFGGKPFPCEVVKETENVDERYGGSEAKVLFHISGKMPKNARLRVYAVKEKGRRLCFEITAHELREKMCPIQIYVDTADSVPKDGLFHVQGWAVSRKPVTVFVTDEAGGDVPGCRAEMYQRLDVVSLFDECRVDDHAGFNVEIRPIPKAPVVLHFISGNKEVRKTFRTDFVSAKAARAGHILKKGGDYFKYYGLTALWQKVTDRLFNPAMHPVVYADWIKKHLPTDWELAKQKNTTFPYMPIISVVVPLYRTPEEFLTALVDSVRAQSYAHWELILSDGSGENSPLTGVLAQLEKSDTRIHAVKNEKQLRIAENTNAAIAAAKGDFITFADHDDLLVPSALFEVVKAVNENPKAQLLYTDEDKIGTGGIYMQPNLKPDYDPDFLDSVNYICHLLTVRRSLLESVGGLRPEYDGAQDYDFVLRCTEKCAEPLTVSYEKVSETVIHIPKVLYHWRFFEGSTAANPESKQYAFDAGRRAIEAHYRREELPATVEDGAFPGIYRTHWHWIEKPLVSVLIPNKDHADDLRKCLAGFYTGKGYDNFEIIIIENNSTEPETFAYYEALKKAHDNIKVVTYKGGFNYSAINNFGAREAAGEYLFLLNNDTEWISEDVIGELLGFAQRPDVGAVGARLYYEDDTIQHAGAIVGWGGVAGHAFVNQGRGETGYQHRIICAQDLSAVTAACMMVKKSAFDKAGGFTEELAVAFNDIDLCMKIRAQGLHVVYDPYCELYHYESKSRGLDQGDPEKVRRFQHEIEIFQKRWPEILRDGDPYYNPNLSMVTQDFSLKRN